MCPYRMIRNPYTVQAKSQPHITVSNFQRSFLLKNTAGLESQISHEGTSNYIWIYNVRRNHKNIIEIKVMEETLVLCYDISTMEIICTLLNNMKNCE